MLFGSVRTFGLYFSAAPIIGGGNCAVNLSSAVPTQVVSSQFAMSIPFEGHASGAFASPASLTVTVGGLQIPNSAYVCSAGSSVPASAPMPGTYVVSMTR